MWYDTEGKRIQAHGGSVMYLDGTYYWYGENKEKTDGVADIWHWGVRCYPSTDLYNWKDEGIIIEPRPDDPASSLHPRKCMDRPHIIYNRQTKKFVCWMKIMNDDGTQSETIMTADHILRALHAGAGESATLKYERRGFRSGCGRGRKGILFL